MNSDWIAKDLCGVCGFCCNGVIFADVRLGPEDQPEQLRSAGIPLRSCQAAGGGVGGALGFTQPCAGYDGRGCRLYGARPRYCREFECMLFKRVRSGGVTPSQALRQVRMARGEVARALKLMAAVGDREEGLSLMKRFRRLARRMERGQLDRDAAATFGELTLTMHRLSRLLNERFYPGSD